MKILLGGISHETNTYCRGTTPIDAFRHWRGEEIVETFAGTGSDPGGVLHAAGEHGCEVVPTYLAVAQPSGVIATDAYETMKTELIERITAALPAEGVALNLHGAAVAEGIDDVEGDLCAAIREVIGPEVGMVATFDLHGNVTQEMLDTLDCAFPVHLYPHTDEFDRGVEAVELLVRLAKEQIRATSYVEHLPMLLPPSTTDENPARTMNLLCRRQETLRGLIDCSVFHGFPYADIPIAGVHVVATAEGDESLARDAAKSVADWIWNSREDFRPKLAACDEAVAAARSARRGPVVIADIADNPGGGAPGDGTHLLRAMLDAGVTDSCFGSLYDPDVVEQAVAAGVGSTVDVSLGGKHDDIHGKPVEVSACVKSITDGRYYFPVVKSHVELGPCVRLTAEGIDVVVASRAIQTFDPNLFSLHGIDVTKCKIVGLKSSAHFRAGFAPVASQIILADSPGFTGVGSVLDLNVFPRTRTRRPVWPIDEDVSYG